MPIIKSAAKRMRQTAKNRARNQHTKKNLKQATKELQANITNKDSKKAQESLRKVFSALDTAAKKNVIHKNKVARKKSTYNARVKALGGKPTTKKPTAKATQTKSTATKKPAAKKSAPKKTK